MAKSPWGDLTPSDAHVHFFSHSFYDGLARQMRQGSAEELGPLTNWIIPARDPVILARTWVAEMDRFMLRRICLIASSHGDELSVATAVSAYPERFYGYFLLDPTQPDAAERAEEAANTRHLHGVCLFPAMHSCGIGDPRALRIIEIASDQELVVFVHCGALSIGVRQKLGLASQFDMRFSNPLDLHAVALRFPRVHFVVPHFGAGLFREALMLADLCPNVYLDTSSSNRWMTYEGLDLRTVFQRAIKIAGWGRLLFGTDSSFFPRGWNAAVFEQQATALYELGYDEQQVAGIFGGNLGRILEARRTRFSRL